jgi:UDP-N-acetylglucosamine transferase subunit ALG13
MIFVTIGTQEPFDRLIKAVDELAPLLNDQIIVQANKTNYSIKNMQLLDFVSPKDFNYYFNQAKLIISHAGMGTIISALTQEKPIIVMPRLMKYNEHRSEHQLATAKRLDDLGYIRVAYDEQDLKNKLIDISQNHFNTLHKVGNVASDQLIDSLKQFITL